jgi:16S rRNA (guanine527-N7)-methyltransferase
MRSEFLNSLIENQATFDVKLRDEALERIADYYELILEHNPILHLVGPCTPEEFATRHILESLTLLKHLPHGATFADIGSGGGLPAIPCLIEREDLTAVLIESKERKSAFLTAALASLGLNSRSAVIGRQFSEITRPNVTHVTCRALDKFTEKLPKLIKWAGHSSFLFFGGGSLGEALTAHNIRYGRELMPLSEQRFLFFMPSATQNSLSDI